MVMCYNGRWKNNYSFPFPFSFFNFSIFSDELATEKPIITRTLLFCLLIPWTLCMGICGNFDESRRLILKIYQALFCPLLTCSFLSMYLPFCSSFFFPFLVLVLLFQLVPSTNPKKIANLNIILPHNLNFELCEKLSTWLGVFELGL